MNISDQRLREACLAAEEILIADFLDPHEPAHTFSPEFERKMDTLLRKQARRNLYQKLQRAAGFFLAILVGCSLWLTVDAEARERFIGWVREPYDAFQTHYYFEGTDTTDAADVEYVLTKIPDGYVLEEVIELGDGNTVTQYVNENGFGFSFGYFTNRDSSHLFVRTDSMEYKNVQVNGNSADYYYSKENSESSAVIWIDSNTNMLLFVDGWFSEVELLKIAESISLKSSN